MAQRAEEELTAAEAATRWHRDYCLGGESPDEPGRVCHRPKGHEGECSEFPMKGDFTAHGVTGEAESDPQPQRVNHPAHYNHGQIEAIDVIEDWGLNFSVGSAVKYLCRASAPERDKAETVTDLMKARWYISREILRRNTIELG